MPPASTTFEPVRPTFLCDAMLGGLARFLRAAGYDAEFEQGIDDGELVARARRNRGRVNTRVFCLRVHRCAHCRLRQLTRRYATEDRYFIVYREIAASTDIH